MFCLSVSYAQYGGWGVWNPTENYFVISDIQDPLPPADSSAGGINTADSTSGTVSDTAKSAPYQGSPQMSSQSSGAMLYKEQIREYTLNGPA